MRSLPIALLLAPAVLADQRDGLPLLQGHNKHDHTSHNHTAEALHTHIHTGWESRYVSEGRDNLGGRSIASTTIDASWDFLSAGIWYGHSPDANYDELELAASLHWHWNVLECHASYSHIRFPIDQDHDHEIGLGFAVNELPFESVLHVDAYHSMDAEGYFIETSIDRSFQLAESLSIDPAIVFGFNDGYVSDGHNGANHIAARIGSSWQVMEQLSLHGHVSYNWAIDREEAALPGDQALRDFAHVGLSLEYAF